MTKLEVLQLQRFRIRYGGPLDMMPKTADEALTMAIEAENTYRDIGPFDPARGHFIQQMLDFEAIAVLLEKEAAAKVKA